MFQLKSQNSPRLRTLGLWCLLALTATPVAAQSETSQPEATPLSTADLSPQAIECLQTSYSQYVDASLAWYQDLIQETTAKNDKLTEVGQWFLTGRQHHFELNRAAFNEFIQTSPAKINLNHSVESWLTLTQADIRQLSVRKDALGQAAAQTYQDRQKPPHPQNYQLREAFAQNLSQDDALKPQLNQYNQKLTSISAQKCLVQP
ncbi:MAG: hypothetical protein ACPHV3_07670 [Vibrio sp.]